jgi:predicted nuclease of predicted toxin-antitoxin system
MQLDWEIWLDMHFSPAIAKWMIEDTGWNVKSSYFLKLNTDDDIVIYQKAKAAGKIIFISKDIDLDELINRLGSPPKLIWVRIGNCDNRTLWNILKKQIQEAVKILTETEVTIVEID